MDGNSNHAAEAWRNADTNDLEDTKKATEVRVDEEKRQGLWTTRPPKSRAGRADSLSWELVTSRLLHEDMKRKEQGGGSDGAAHGQGQAFMTTETGRRKGRQVPVKTTSACHHCGDHGHWIAKCPVRIRENAERQRPQRASIAQSEDHSDDYLFSVGESGSITKSSCVWLVDSGATQHMTYLLEGTG
ncbi:unnamed protein product [Peronospora destructor]|uniref:CCHC-type domain-containing protein n=1 Tax=Peronospora destructor TaxID=86335 RepID=A0AAV0VB13_9STRA|nr:unnamed protein product [Peronospora destructor]